MGEESGGLCKGTLRMEKSENMKLDRLSVAQMLQEHPIKKRAGRIPAAIPLGIGLCGS